MSKALTSIDKFPTAGQNILEGEQLSISARLIVLVYNKLCD